MNLVKSNATGERMERFQISNRKKINHRTENIRES